MITYRQSINPNHSAFPEHNNYIIYICGWTVLLIFLSFFSSCSKAQVLPVA